MINSDPTKQIVIMAQSSTRLAVEMAMAGKIDCNIKDVAMMAHSLMDIELKLAGKHIETFKSIQSKSREIDVDKLIEGIKDKKTLSDAWSKLDEGEQVKHLELFNKLSKKYK